MLPADFQQGKKICPLLLMGFHHVGKVMGPGVRNVLIDLLDGSLASFLLQQTIIDIEARLREDNKNSGFPPASTLFSYDSLLVRFGVPSVRMISMARLIVSRSPTRKRFLNSASDFHMGTRRVSRLKYSSAYTLVYLFFMR